jgi:predicted DNA-binding WGR domain protein
MNRVRRFEFVGGGSSKFWEISHQGAQVTVRFGRIGTTGQTQIKDLGSETAAAFHVANLIKEKLAKGYVAVKPQGASASAEAEGEVESGQGLRRPPLLPPYRVPELPADGPADIGEVHLPAGRRLRGNPTMGPPGIEVISAPVLWLTDAPVAESGMALYRLRGPAASRGLTPVAMSSMEGDDARPWASQEFSPTDPRRVDHFDAAQVLADMWGQCVSAEDEESLDPVRPFGLEFPGLATAPLRRAPSALVRLFAPATDPNDDRGALRAFPARRIGLVAAGRAADSITALGWAGGVNLHQDPVLMSAVLRSWEDRWAARIVEIGFDTLTLTVGVPPRDRTTAFALAAEHFAFCPDNIWQEAGTLEAYADTLRGSQIWKFWWD